MGSHLDGLLMTGGGFPRKPEPIARGSVADRFTQGGANGFVGSQAHEGKDNDPAHGKVGRAGREPVPGMRGLPFMPDCLSDQCFGSGPGGEALCGDLVEPMRFRNPLGTHGVDFRRPIGLAPSAGDSRPPNPHPSKQVHWAPGLDRVVNLLRAPSGKPTRRGHTSVKLEA